MNRLFLGIAFFLLVAATPWAQSTWRGQAEIWTAADVPADGLVAASNEFPLKTLLDVENYRTKKTIQVRVVAPLPAGSSDLVLLSPKAATALGINPGEVPLVGVQIDPTGVDRADNPDPDVNPLAQAPPATAPATPASPSTPASAPGNSPGVATPDALPLPATAGAVPLAVANEPDSTPSTPGKRVFESTTSPDPLAPPVTDSAMASPPTPVPAPVSVPTSTPAPTLPVAATPDKSTDTTAPVAEAPVAPPVAPVIPVPSPPVVATPVVVAPSRIASANAWVSSPGKLEGPILGQLPVLAAPEKGQTYLQLGAWATEAEMLATLNTVKSYVPLSLYKAKGAKNPWRVIATAPKAQLGVLLMLFRSEGLMFATVVKG